jgi:hypothetical protein
LKIKVLKTVTLHVGVKLSLTLREEHRLRVFENRVLGRIFGPKGDEVTGGWRKLHNEQLHKLYSSSQVGSSVLQLLQTWLLQRLPSNDHSLQSYCPARACSIVFCLLIPAMHYRVYMLQYFRLELTVIAKQTLHISSTISTG